ncbi:hypothetical protein [Candidatus Thiodictyon syntrophicum]|uniref:Uncharacterized protein n=1 Tax=Candidatus Thiodictyon syntrophicum TaxID=1166950 RepID=A0A2K8UB15_9GAMM|nr:hypothetical protein [Candidatus Thiodictyon syntrophicum]AUB82773.1 hypothetical protein THSYN_18725 [Candidatus Thiodictyon syntrophicum]
MPHPAPANSLPPRPRALLRLGFAGRRVLSAAQEETLDTTLAQVFAVIGRQLAALTPGVPVQVGRKPPVSAFYARRPPLLRLVTGLCEGADTVAARVLDRLHIAPDGAGPDGAGDDCIETELAAVLPFDLPSYRASRAPDFHPEFDRQVARCAYVVVADGIYDKPDPDAAASERLALASQRRGRAYRAQSALLLRHADLLVAAADPNAPAKPGGTLETVPAALACDLPVLFINTVRGGVWLIRPAEDLAGALAGPPCTDADLADLVTAILVGPDVGLAGADQAERQAHREGLRLLEEYFDGAAAPPRWRHTGERRRTLREWVWEQVTRRFADPKTQPPTPPRPRAAWWARAWRRLAGRFAAPVAPPPVPRPPAFKDYRTRATALNYHYSGLYRGAFVLNYGLAVAAVALATAGLALLAVHHGAHWLAWSLLGLAAAKLWLLIIISRNTHRARDEHWNDRAVDYRYLAERLRALLFLPACGAYRPPAAAPPRHAERCIHQSAVDWLCDAIARGVSPTDPTDPAPQILTLAPAAALDLVRGGWIAEQITYHDRTQGLMHRLDRFAEQAGARLSQAVIWVVAFDLLLLVLYLTHRLPWADWIKHDLAPWLIFLAAVLPAAVASCNGLRFQGETRRLAERSKRLARVLGGRAAAAQGLAGRLAQARAQPATDPGAWSLDILRLAERVAEDCLHEVADWSVLYAKELPET